MRRWVSYAVIGLATGVALMQPATAAHRKTRELFNGKDLTNFYTWLVDSHREDPKRVFRVENVDGAPAVRVTGDGFGGFVTKEEFENYHLSLEFSWGKATWGSRKNATRDSGVLLHAQGPDGNTGTDFNGPWMLSQECQVIQGGVGDFIMVQGQFKAGERITPKLTAKTSKDRDGETVYDPKNGKETEYTGGRINWWGRDPDWADVLNFRGKQDVESPGSGWTHLEVICDGDKITNIVNGTVVNAATRSSLTKGKLIFQSEGAEIYYRNITLTSLR